MCLGAIGVIREVYEENGLPMARVEGDVRAPEVCLLYVPDARSGDHVLVELGFAVETLEPEEAAEALRMRGTSAGREREVSRRSMTPRRPRARSAASIPVPPLADGQARARVRDGADQRGRRLRERLRRDRAFGSGGGVYTTAKNLVAAVVLLLVGAVATKGRSEEGFTRPRTGRQWAGLGVVAVIGGSVPFLLFFEGLARASSVQAAFLHKSLLIWVVLLAWPLLGERIGPLQIVAIGLLLVGQAALQGGIGQVGFGAAR